ncbi:MAG: thiolase family protein [Deltaproteobacteria bacterium]|nr:thiolase family protein [Deltaproteobacteria bacterium]
MSKVMIIGGGMTKFGRHPHRNLKSLAEEAVSQALADAGVDRGQLQAAWVGNASQGVLQGQESVRGQAVLFNLGLGGIPIVNVENACASSATALYGARAFIALGEYDLALILGMEKMYFPDRAQVLPAFEGCMDVELLPGIMRKFHEDEERIRREQEAAGVDAKAQSGQRSIFMDLYAQMCRAHMEKYGTTQRQFAAIASKNHNHSQYNPRAQYTVPMTVAEVLATPEVAWPLTRAMCSPIGDGAAAAVVCSEELARKIGAKHAVEVAVSLVGSGLDEEAEERLGRTSLAALAARAYERAGLGPEDVDLAEVHDATAYGELNATEQLGFCALGEGGPYAQAGHTSLGGKKPVNPSGGLECQGHPIGATGIRQIVELYWHLAGGGRAGARQVAGARVGLAQNAGGDIAGSEGALSVTILKK